MDKDLKPYCVDKIDEDVLARMNNTRATDCPAADVEAIKRIVFKTIQLSCLVDTQDARFLSDEIENNIQKHLASHNLIRRTLPPPLIHKDGVITPQIPDDMVLVPRTPTKRMVQFGVDNREDGGGVTDIYIAMIHGHETEKAYEEGK